MKKSLGILPIGILITFLLFVAIPNAEAGVTLRTDKSSYGPEENINFTVKNDNSYPINFAGINIRNLATGETTNTDDWCSPDPDVVCIAIIPLPVALEPGQTYNKTWYLIKKGIYIAYIDWQSEPIMTCQAIGCPIPENHSGRTYSRYFRVI